MSPTTALWVASLLGASLFFSSGVLSADVVLRLLTGKLKLSPARPAATVALETRAPTKAVPTEAAPSAPAPAEPAPAEPAKLGRPEESRELAELRALADEARRRLGEAQERAALVPALRRRLQDLEQAETTSARTARALRDDLRATSRALDQARGDVERLSAELEARRDTREQAHQHELLRLGEEQRERSLRLKMLTARVAELEIYADENAALRSERDGLLREVERLRRTARESLAPPPAAPARPAAPASVTQLATRRAPSGTTRLGAESEHTLEASLKLHLGGLSSREPGLIAVLSDDNGFPVAGVGSDQQQESVAVLTSLAQQLAARVQELVDLERIERMELADVAGRALRVRFFAWETHPIALGCLGKRSLATNPDEERVVAAFPKLLCRAGSA